MESAGRERGKEVRKRPAGGAKRQGNAKKILNRGNEPTDLLKKQDLAFFGAKNELKTNSILSAKSVDYTKKAGFRWHVSRDRRLGRTLTLSRESVACSGSTPHPPVPSGESAGAGHPLPQGGEGSLNYRGESYSF